MELRFTNELIEWRGPAPFYFIQTPPDITAEIQVIAAAKTQYLTYTQKSKNNTLRTHSSTNTIPYVGTEVKTQYLTNAQK